MRPLSEASFRTFYYEKFLVKILLEVETNLHNLARCWRRL